MPNPVPPQGERRPSHKVAIQTLGTKVITSLDVDILLKINEEKEMRCYDNPGTGDKSDNTTLIKISS